MNKKLSTREIQLAEKDILDEVVKFLDNNNLSYFLTGGTLLGAIRHKGFIPWDDDIDISMPRPDYDRMQEILSENKNVLSSNLHFHSVELKNLNFPFTKVYNYDITAYDWRFNDKYEKYLWIDIFPVDALPESDVECEKIFKKAEFYRRLLRLRKVSLKYMFQNKKRILINIFKLIFKGILNIIPGRWIVNMYIKQVSRINKDPYNQSKMVGDCVWGYGPEERMEKDKMELIDVEFEGSIYKGLKYYDEFLTNVYGDYMKLPPEEKRVTHEFEAWRINE